MTCWQKKRKGMTSFLNTFSVNGIRLLVNHSIVRTGTVLYFNWCQLLRVYSPAFNSESLCTCVSWKYNDHHHQWSIFINILLISQGWRTVTSIYQSFTPAIIELNPFCQHTIQQLCNVFYFANSEPYEGFWIAEHYSPETNPSTDGDKLGWLYSLSPSWGNRAAGLCPGEWLMLRGQCSRPHLLNEWTCLRFQIVLPDADSSMEAIISRDIIIESGFLWSASMVLIHSGHNDKFSIKWRENHSQPQLSACQERVGWDLSAMRNLNITECLYYLV